MRRLSITVMMGLAIPAFAAAQHRGGAIMSAPAMSARGGTVISRGGGAPMRGSVRVQSGTQSAARTGAPSRTHTDYGPPNTSRQQLGIRSNGNGFNDVPGLGFGFGSGATNFQNAPGLGFDFPHQAAVSGNRRMRGDRFGRGGLASATLSWADRGITIRDFTMKGSQPIRSRPMHSLRQQTTTLPRMNTPQRMHTPRSNARAGVRGRRLRLANLKRRARPLRSRTSNNMFLCAATAAWCLPWRMRG